MIPVSLKDEASGLLEKLNSFTPLNKLLPVSQELLVALPDWARTLLEESNGDNHSKDLLRAAKRASKNWDIEPTVLLRYFSGAKLGFYNELFQLSSRFDLNTAIRAQAVARLGEARISRQEGNAGSGITSKSSWVASDVKTAAKKLEIEIADLENSRPVKKRRLSDGATEISSNSTEPKPAAFAIQVPPELRSGMVEVTTGEPLEQSDSIFTGSYASPTDEPTTDEPNTLVIPGTGFDPIDVDTLPFNAVRILPDVLRDIHNPEVKIHDLPLNSALCILSSPFPSTYALESTYLSKEPKAGSWFSRFLSGTLPSQILFFGHIVGHRNNDHWVFVDLKTDLGSAAIYDSLQAGNFHSQATGIVKNFFPSLQWTYHTPECPQQSNAIDCGIAAFGNALCAISGVPLPRIFRPRMLRSILCHLVSEEEGDWSLCDSPIQLTYQPPKARAISIHEIEQLVDIAQDHARHIAGLRREGRELVDSMKEGLKGFRDIFQKLLEACSVVTQEKEHQRKYEKDEHERIYEVLDGARKLRQFTREGADQTLLETLESEQQNAENQIKKLEQELGKLSISKTRFERVLNAIYADEQRMNVKGEQLAMID